MTKDNIKELLNLLEFEHDGNIYTKKYENVNEPLKVDISGDGHIFYRVFLLVEKRLAISWNQKILSCYIVSIVFYGKAIILFISS